MWKCSSNSSLVKGLSNNKVCLVSPAPISTLDSVSLGVFSVRVAEASKSFTSVFKESL